MTTKLFFCGLGGGQYTNENLVSVFPVFLVLPLQIGCGQVWGHWCKRTPPGLASGRVREPKGFFWTVFWNQCRDSQKTQRCCPSEVLWWFLWKSVSTSLSLHCSGMAGASPPVFVDRKGKQETIDSFVGRSVVQPFWCHVSPMILRQTYFIERSNRSTCQMLGFSMWTWIWVGSWGSFWVKMHPGDKHRTGRWWDQKDYFPFPGCIPFVPCWASGVYAPKN